MNSVQWCKFLPCDWEQNLTVANMEMARGKCPNRFVTRDGGVRHLGFDDLPLCFLLNKSISRLPANCGGNCSDADFLYLKGLSNAEVFVWALFNSQLTFIARLIYYYVNNDYLFIKNYFKHIGLSVLSFFFVGVLCSMTAERMWDLHTLEVSKTQLDKALSNLIYQTCFEAGGCTKLPLN